MKPKKVREERRQFAEAILGRGVLVVEGGTEASVIPVVADIMDADKSINYTHLDLAGVSVYDAKTDAQVPGLTPVFKKLGKRCYGLHDTPNGAFPPSAASDAASFDVYLVIPHKSIEKLLVVEMPDRPKRAFLTMAAAFPDYPVDAGYLTASASPAEVDQLVESVLLKRKGASGYAAMLVAEAHDASELPNSYVTFLLAIEADMAAIAAATAPAAPTTAPTATSAAIPVSGPPPTAPTSPPAPAAPTSEPGSELP